MANMCGYSPAMGMGRRIHERLEELGWQQVDLLHRVPDMTAATLSALIKRDSVRSQWSESLAEALGVFHRWLQTGEGPKLLPAGGGADVSAFKPSVRVPLYDWTTIATMQTTKPTQPAEWISAIASAPAPGAFAVRVDTDAMTAPPGSSPTFPRGTVLIIDPGRKPRAGDYVVARDPQTGHATFKRLASDAGRHYLVALNPAFPSVPITSLEESVIGVCCEWQTGGTL